MNEENTSSESEQHPAGKVFESLKDAIKQGAADGSAKAAEQAPKAQDQLTKALHTFAYSLAYGANFVGTYGKVSMPENVKDTVVDGFKKGAEAFRSRTTVNEQQQAAAVVPVDRSPSDTSDPGPSMV